MPHYIAQLPTLEGRTLLDELNHRIKNELASVINLVTFKAGIQSALEYCLLPGTRRPNKLQPRLGGMRQETFAPPDHGHVPIRVRF